MTGTDGTRLPDTIGRYRIEGIVGRGAMGVIYRAHDPSIGRRVAIKLVAADLLDGHAGEEYIRRFRREAQAAGRLNHPNIIAVYDFGLHEGAPFLVMEFVEGTTLQNALKRGAKFNPAAVGTIGARVLDALDCAHAAGIVHRDVKPANVMISSVGAVKVADFGICRIEDAEATQTGDVVGTPAYMSPEQCRGDQVDARSDLFSAGAVLFELLSGERAFGGGTVVEITRRILNGPTPVLPDAVELAVPGLGQVLDRAMEKEAAARFASAREMARALASATGGAAPTRGGDETVVLGPLAPAPPRASAGLAATVGVVTFGSDVLALISRRLAGHVGPIAGRLVQDAARNGGTVEALCDALARSIGEETERRQFREAAMRDLRAAPGGGSIGTGVATALPAWEPHQLDRARAALTAHVGPIARMLVDRAAKGVATEVELWERLSKHIDDERERAAFLRKLKAG